MKTQCNSIYIPFEEGRWVGGPATFMQNLESYLDRHHYSYLPSIKHARNIFFPTAFPLKKLDKIKKRGGYIIQRLDGVYYPSKHGEEYAEINCIPKIIYQDYADLVIFQSQYSLAQCFALFGTRENYKIIINGVDPSVFYPDRSFNLSAVQGKIRLVTTGRFRNLDMLEPVILALDQLVTQFDFELIVIGPVVNPELDPYIQRSYVRHIESLALPEIAEELRQSHIFIYSHLNPPCPNSVVEAVSCGLPVVGFDSGAMTELCFFAKELFAFVSDEVFQKYEDFDADKLAEKIMKVVEQYEHYRQVALAHSHLYSFDECGRRYREVFDRYLTKSRALSVYVPYLLQQGMKKLIKFPDSIKNRLQKRLILSSNSLVQRLLMRLPANQFLAVLVSVVTQKTSALSPAHSLKLLFELDKRLYSFEGTEAIRYGNGLHPKHRHIKYHDFFVQHIEPGNQVLDVGCGNGALAYDIATRVADVAVYGIDIAQTDIEYARQHYATNNLTFVCGDVLRDLPQCHIDVIVLSNVLEHIEKRVDFLRTLQERYQPKKFLIRVPIFERDWRVPLKEELGIDYHLDPTHYIEYRQGEFLKEIEEVCLRIHYLQNNWGEIWTEIMPSDMKAGNKELF